MLFNYFQVFLKTHELKVEKSMSFPTAQLSSALSVPTNLNQEQGVLTIVKKELLRMVTLNAIYIQNFFNNDRNFLGFNFVLNFCCLWAMTFCSA